MASIKKYKTDLEHQENVKKASIKKYKTNLKHQESVKKASIEVQDRHGTSNYGQSEGLEKIEMMNHTG